MKILILGGTEEARHLARALVALGHDVTTSLAGRTQDPMLPQGQVRRGGFGGAAGLADHLRREGVERLVDATHPFAAQMSRNAVEAAAEAGVPLVRCLRPEWVPAPGQHWTVVETSEAAAARLPAGARVLLTTGHAGLALFLGRNDCQFFVRVIEAPEGGLPPHATLLAGRPPYDLATERETMSTHRITHLVSKNSGGQQTAAKLQAAAEQGVEVVMIARPAYAPAVEAETVEGALRLILSASA